MANRKRNVAKANSSDNSKNDGQTVKSEPASAAIAAITANIAATSISINDIDHDPIINEEEERTPEDTSALVSSLFKHTNYG